MGASALREEAGKTSRLKNALIKPRERERERERERRVVEKGLQPSSQPKLFSGCFRIKRPFTKY